MLLTAAFMLNADAFGATPAATGKARKANKCVFPNSGKRAPNWVCDQNAKELAVTAVGYAAKSAAGISFMEQIAAADGRVKLARKLNSAARKKSDDRDSAMQTSVTDASLQGAIILKRAYDPKGALYVLVGLDEHGAK